MDSGIYQGPYNNFLEDLERKIPKREVFTQTTVTKRLGTHAYQAKKYLDNAVEEDKLIPIKAYLRGCSPTRLIIADSPIGEVVICPNCHEQLPWPPEGDRITCDCGIIYVQEEDEDEDEDEDDGGGGVWGYASQINFFGSGLVEVEDLGEPGVFHYVDILKRRCSCGQKQLSFCRHMGRVGDFIAALLLGGVEAVWRRRSIPVRDLDFAVLSTVARAWLHPDRRVRRLTYEEIENEVRRVRGLDPSLQSIYRVTGRLEDLGLVEGRVHPDEGIGGKKLVALRKRRLQRLLYHLEPETGQPWSDGGWNKQLVLDQSILETPFLAIGRVRHSSVAIPDLGVKVDLALLSEGDPYPGNPDGGTKIILEKGLMEKTGVSVRVEPRFLATVHLSHSLPNPRPVLLTAETRSGEKIPGIQRETLVGRGIEELSISLKPPEKEVWRPKVSLYKLEEENWVGLGWGRGWGWIPVQRWKGQRQIHTSSITYQGNGSWRVQSFSDPEKAYTVDAIGRSCTCKDHWFRGTYCKHMKKVDQIIEEAKRKWLQQVYMHASLQDFRDMFRSEGVDLSLVKVMEGEDRFTVHPEGYLGETWKHINQVVRTLGGRWISAGKRSRWEIDRQRETRRTSLEDVI